MTNDEIKNRQEETLNNLKKYNETRKTEVIDDQSDTVNKEGDITVIETNKEDLDKFVAATQEVLDDQYALMEKHNLKSVTVEIRKPYICEHCGNIAYQGQIHGLGFCKEKTQYEQ